MPPTPNNLLNTVEAISTVVARLLPVIEHVPDSLGKWVPPIKAAVAANAKLAASIGLAGAASKALRGKLSAVDAVMVGFNGHALTGRKSLGTLGAVGALAVSKIVRHFKDANAAASRLRAQAASLDGALAKTGKRAATSGRSGGGGVNPLTRILATVGAVRLVSGALDGLKDAFDLGGELSDGAAKTGILAEQLLILKQAGKDAGVEDVTSGVGKLQDALVSAVKNGASPAALALGAIGLRARELVNQSPVAQLQAVGAALREIGSPTLRTALAKDIFGKSGPDLLPLLDNATALDEAQRAIGRQAAILGANAAAFDAVSDRLSRSGLKMQGFFVGLASTVLPMVEAATARLESTDLAGKGEAFGLEIRKAVDFFAGAFADPKTFLSIFEDSLAGSLLNAANLLANKLVETSAIFISALLDGADLLVRSITAGLQMALDKMLDKIPGFGKGAGGNFGDYLKAQPATGLKGAATALGKAGDSPFVDFFGASKFFDRATASKAVLGTKGKDLVESFIAPRTAEPGRTPVGNRFGALSSFATFRGPALGGGSNRGSVFGASMAGSLGGSLGGGGPFDFSKVANMSQATRATPLLSAAERSRFEDAKVAAGGARTATTAGAFGVIRSGDAARRKNAERDKERERLANENSVQRSNELLGGIHDYARRTAEAME